MGVHSLRLLDMVSASTHTHLVVRRHVDLMRVGSATCWHR
ncbi:putative leader peptide [Nocardioides furvisabuli]